MSTSNQETLHRLRVAGWLAVILLAALLRFAGIEKQGLQHWDEGAYTAGPLHVGPYGRAPIVPFYAPPLFPALVRVGFALFGTSDTVAIATSGIFSVLSVLVLGLLAGRLFGPAVGLFSALFLATAEYHIAYGRMALTDAPFLFFFLLSLLVFHAAITRHHRGLFIAGGALSGLALLVKYHGFLPFAMAGLFMLLEVAATAVRRGIKEARPGFLDLVRHTLWALLGLAGPLIFLLIHIHETVGLGVYLENRSQWVAGPAVWAFKASFLYMGRAFGEWLSPLLLILALLGLFVIAGRLRRGDRTVRRAAVFFLCWLIPFTLAVPFYKNYPRLLLPLVAALAILAALGARSLSDLIRARLISEEPGTAPRAAWQSVPAVALGLLVAASGVWQARDTLTLHPTGYREAARRIAGLLQPGAKALLLAQHTIFFYLRDLPATCLSHNEEVGRQCLRDEDFDLLAVDLRREHTPEFRAYLEGPGRRRLQLAATIANPLYEITLVNSGGFELLDTLRSQPTSEPALEATTIRIYVPKETP